MGLILIGWVGPKVNELNLGNGFGLSCLRAGFSVVKH